MPDTKANQHDPVVQKAWDDEKFAAYADPETKDKPKLVEATDEATAKTTGKSGGGGSGASTGSAASGGATAAAGSASTGKGSA